MEHSKLSFKRLGYDNFEVWKVRAKQFLTREGLWTLVSDDLPPVKSRSAEWATKNELALQTIGYLVEDSLLRIIQDAETAKDAWQMLRDYYVKDSSVNKVSLIKKLAKLELAEGGDMRQHLMELDTLFERIENVGCRLDEDVKGAFMLASVPSSYENVVTAIQGRMEVFRINFVKTKLLEEYERRREKDNTEEQKAMVAKNVRKNQSDFDQKRLCFACGSPQHLMRNCEMLRKLRGESSMSHEARRNVSSAKSAVEEAGGHICFATIRESTEETWYLDSGASEHMTGKVVNLDWSEDVERQKVILADGKVLFSKRMGAKNMEVMNGEGNAVQIRLEKVLVVEGLSVNLISVQAITRKGFEVSFNVDECRILRNGQIVVTGVREGQLYRLTNVNV